MATPDPRTNTGTLLVTGAHGFIGRRIAARWLDHGWKVRGLVRRDEPLDGVELVIGDVADEAVVGDAVAGVDLVVHTAAYFQDDFDEAVKVNVDGTRAVARAALAEGVARFVHLSTCGVYDLVDVLEVTEDTPVWPFRSDGGPVYGVTKAQAEREVEDAMREGLPAVILRPPNVLGADRLNAWSHQIAVVLKEGKLKLPGAGTNTWPWVHVDNLLHAIELAALHDAAVGETFTVVDGHTTWGDYVSIFANWLGVQPGVREVRPPYDTFHGRFRTDKLRSTLPYEPAKTFDDAVEATKRHLIAEGILTSA